MDHPLDPRLQLHERPKVHQPRHRPRNPLPHLVRLRSPIPRLRLQLLQPQRDPFRLRIHAQNLHLNLLPHAQHIFRGLHPAPRHIADMQQPVHAPQIHERAIRRKAPHRPAHHLALAHPGQARLLQRKRLLLQHPSPVHHHILFHRIQLRNAARNLLPHQLLHLARLTRPTARRRQKRPHAHIHREPALHHARHRPHHRRLLPQTPPAATPNPSPAPPASATAHSTPQTFRPFTETANFFPGSTPSASFCETLARGSTPSVLYPISRYTPSASSDTTVPSSCFASPSALMRMRVLKLRQQLAERFGRSHRHRWLSQKERQRQGRE